LSADITVPEIDAFLHEPARLRLLVFLSVLNQADFMFLLRQSGLSKGNLSVQMGRLEEAGLISVDKSFVDNRPRTTFSLTKKGKDALRAYKRTMRDLLEEMPD